MRCDFGFLGFPLGGKMLEGELCRRIRIHRVISCGDAWLERGGREHGSEGG